MRCSPTLSVTVGESGTVLLSLRADIEAMTNSDPSFTCSMTLESVPGVPTATRMPEIHLTAWLPMVSVFDDDAPLNPAGTASATTGPGMAAASLSDTSLLTGLTPGTTSFATLITFRSGLDQGCSFANREIIAVPY